ncbi:hypothetical protein N8290_01910 [Pseudomonadales bacterium]|nr:hypothetical protein [Pseudomonadales bacterium]MDC1368292.1 hypothetical protein [Pseudomonadales bacterium]
MDALTEQEVSVLKAALDDEYHAWASYDQVITDFGEVRPFCNIRDAEARHIQALSQLFAQYGLAIPENLWPGNVARYPDLLAACKAGVEAEIANGALYERLIAQARKPDILRVLRNLQAASQQRHLVAFQRCVQRLEGGPNGRGGRDT